MSGNLSKYDKPFFKAKGTGDSRLEGTTCKTVVKQLLKKAKDFRSNPSKTECSIVRPTKCTNDEDDSILSHGKMFGVMLVRKKIGSFFPEEVKVDIGSQHNKVQWLDREKAEYWYRAVDQDTLDDQDGCGLEGYDISELACVVADETCVASGSGIV